VQRRGGAATRLGDGSESLRACVRPIQRPCPTATIREVELRVGIRFTGPKSVTLRLWKCNVYSRICGVVVLNAPSGPAMISSWTACGTATSANSALPRQQAFGRIADNGRFVASLGQKRSNKNLFRRFLAWPGLACHRRGEVLDKFVRRTMEGVNKGMVFLADSQTRSSRPTPLATGRRSNQLCPRAMACLRWGDAGATGHCSR
jgi:hypothetical protein